MVASLLDEKPGKVWKTMLLSLLFLLVALVVLAGILALVVLGEAWLLQRVFDAELWQLALVVLGSMGVVLYLGTKFLTAASTLPFLLDEEDDEDGVEEEIGPPPWRRNPPSSKQDKSQKPRR
jgi:hypothetical protein